MRDLNAFIDQQRKRTYKTRATAQKAIDQYVEHAPDQTGYQLIAQQSAGRFVAIIVNASPDSAMWWLHGANFPVFGVVGG